MMGTLWWGKLPREAGRLSPALGGALSDGAYLTAWPLVAALAPVLALVIGVALGSRRPESWVVPTSSIAMMAILVIVSGVGAALGAWLALGYAIGDFVLRSHPAPAGHVAYGLYTLAHVRAPLVIVYVVLAGLAVLVPLASRQLSGSRALGIRPGTTNAATTRMVAHVVLAGLLTMAWLITAPILLHPVFTWQAVHPPAAIVPSRPIAWMVALLAAGVALARDRLESIANTRPGYAHFEADARRSRPVPTPSSGRALPVELSLIMGAAIGTFLLSGLLQSFVDALLLGSVLLLFGVLRSVVNHVGSWTARMSRVPFTARLAASAVIGVLVARGVIGALWQQSPVFLPMACALGGSLCVTALLLAGSGSPAASPAPARPPSSPAAAPTGRVAKHG